MSDMQFLFYKAVSQFIMPMGLTFLFLVCSALFFILGKKKPAVLLLLWSIFWLWLWSAPLWSDFIRGGLESKFGYRPATEFPSVDAIVVLGGGVRGYAGPKLPMIDLNRAADRELFCAQLYQANKAKVVILTGGADPVNRTGAAAIGMKIFLINLGIPAAAIRTGVNSRNTVENVQEVLHILKSLKGKTILLVTSAMHMQRAYWLFSQSGLNVIPAPTDFEVVNIPFSLYRILPDAEALENSSRAAREFIGLGFYKLHKPEIK